MTDRELLKLAAKAAGIRIDKSPYNGGGNGNTGFDILGNAVLDWHNGVKWNPLTDDGDALRLAVQLRIAIRLDDPAAVSAGWSANQSGAPTLDGKGPWFWKEWHWSSERQADDPGAAARRAIVKAAAELAR